MDIHCIYNQMRGSGGQKKKDEEYSGEEETGHYLIFQSFFHSDDLGMENKRVEFIFVFDPYYNFF